MNKITSPAIIVLFSLFSCNTGKHYANMRIQQETVSYNENANFYYESANHESEKANSFSDTEVTDTIVTSDTPASSNKNLYTKKLNEVTGTTSENEQPVFPVSENKSIIPASQNSGPPSSGQLLLLGLIFILFVLIVLGTLIFLIAWIFTTAVLAFKFALWALFILVVGYLLVALIVNAISLLF